MTTAEEYAEDFIQSMARHPLLHGDSEHQHWLKDKLEEHVRPLAQLFIAYAREVNGREW